MNQVSFEIAERESLTFVVPGQIEILRRRVDAMLGKLDDLTQRLLRGELTAHESLRLELPLVIEMGQLQDRLRLLGCHAYDGCAECRPSADPQSKGYSHDA